MYRHFVTILEITSASSIFQKEAVKELNGNLRVMRGNTPVGALTCLLCNLKTHSHTHEECDGFTQGQEVISLLAYFW